jgi:phosphoribosylaminoimidazole-succinocarboxamide synthase
LGYGKQEQGLHLHSLISYRREMDLSKAPRYKALVEAELPRVINRTTLAVGSKYTGKVRDVYATKDCLLLVTTDRLSAFDRLLACIPFKGAVLNLTSAWWFNKTAHIIPNHVISVPHPNVVGAGTTVR